jgi:hypothetical protein
LPRDAKARPGPAENSRTSAIAGPQRLPSDRPLEGQGRALSGKHRLPDEPRRRPNDPRSTRLDSRQRHEAHDISRDELDAHGFPKLVDAKGAQILVEIAQPG